MSLLIKWLRRVAAEKSRARLFNQPMDPSMLTVPIETISGKSAHEFTSEEWTPVKVGERRSAKPEPSRQRIQVGELLNEEHHRACRGPWLVGRYRAGFIIEQGLQPHHRVLDIGCGSGRVGIWIVQHLLPERYFGIDRHLRSLVAYSAYELRLHGLAVKQPRLLLDSEFHFAHFGQRFDMALDIKVTNKLSDERFRAAMGSLRSVLAPEGRVFMHSLKAKRVDEMQRLGFEAELETRVLNPIQTGPRVADWDDWWYIFKNRGT